MKQSRAASLTESLANVVVGLGVASLANWLVLPLFGFRPTFSDVAGIGAIMTVISIARSYALRRFFEAVRTRRAAAEPDEFIYGDMTLAPPVGWSDDI